jgi:hypothetical protein
MGANTPAPAAAFPTASEYWRLSDSEFKALGPLPVEPVPDEANVSRIANPPASPQDYSSYSYVAPPFPLTYYGLGIGFAYYSGNHGHRHRSYPRHSYGARRHR